MRFKLFGKFERHTHGQVIPSGSSSHGFSSSLWPQQSQKRGLVSSSVGKWKNKRGSQESNISKTVLWSCMFVKPSQHFIMTFTMVSSVQIFYSNMRTAVLEWGLHHAVNLFSDFSLHTSQQCFCVNPSGLESEVWKKELGMIIVL